MNVNNIISQIIPPDDYQHRNGFSNESLIDNLSFEDKLSIENALIDKLKEKSDMLIVETLGYMKSEKALPVLYELMKNLTNEIAKIITAFSIFRINQDQTMVLEAKTIFEKMKDKYQLISVFYYMVKFNSFEITKLIQAYVNDSDYLISYNAKQVLGKLESF